MAKKTTIAAPRPRRATSVEMEIGDGETLELVANFGLLKAMERKYPGPAKAAINAPFEAYEPETRMEKMYAALYGAYVCGCVMRSEDPMDEQDFYEAAGNDMTYASTVWQRLFYPKGKAAGAARS